MKKPTQHRMFAGRCLALLTALAAFASTTRAQVTFQQVTNGLVSLYPLDQVITNGSTLTTPDHLGGRDLILSPQAATNQIFNNTVLVTGRPAANPASVSNAFNMNQTGGATVLYYNSKGQDPLTGGGDFLPFCNQINATMNFWIKGNGPGTDTRFFGEADTTGGHANPLYLWGDHSSAPGKAHLLFRQQEEGTGANGSIAMTDGTYQWPAVGQYMGQGDTYTAATILDNTWHMFTVVIDSNANPTVYVDGVLDTGGAGGGRTDLYGNPSVCLVHPMTNYYYTTNLYPKVDPPATNPPPNGYVRWMLNGIFTTGSTVFGGFKRGGISAGLPTQFDEIAFWNRALSAEEINFVRTNGLPGIPIIRPLLINSFTADYAEIGKGDSVTLRWNVTGADTNAGGIVISGVGDVSSQGLIGSVNVNLNGDQTFTLTAHNGAAADQMASVSIKTFPGVDSAWNLIQRFDGLFADTESGIVGNGWVSAGSDFSGSFDKWNVITITNSGAQNKVISPRTGFVPSGTSITGYESRGAVAYARLGSLTLDPGQSNTVFFRFSLREGGVEGGASDLDMSIGLTDYNIIGPGGGTGGGLGPFFNIVRNTGGNFSGGPFNLTANDRDESTGGITNTYSYIGAGNVNGIETNVNYMVWLDVLNRNTRGVDNGSGDTNTVDEALFSVWLQKQGDPSRTLLFSNFHGNRDYRNYNKVNDNPTPFLDKVFFNIATHTISTVEAGAYFGTNMVTIDDVYMSKSGFTSTIPRLFDLTSIVRDGSGVTIKWDSLGSLYQTNTYSVLRKLDLKDATWTPLATGLPSGGDSTTYTDTAPPSGAAYYRISWP